MRINPLAGVDFEPDPFEVALAGATTVKEVRAVATRFAKHASPTHGTLTSQKVHGNWAHPGYTDRIDSTSGDVTVTLRPGTKPHTQTALFHPDLFEQTPPDIPKPPTPKTLPPSVTHPFTHRGNRLAPGQSAAPLLVDSDGNPTMETRFVGGEPNPYSTPPGEMSYGLLVPSDWSQVTPEVALSELKAMDDYYMQLHEVAVHNQKNSPQPWEPGGERHLGRHKFLKAEIAGLQAEMDAAARRALPALIARGESVREEVHTAMEKARDSRARTLAEAGLDESQIRWARAKDFKQFFADEPAMKPLFTKYDALESKKQDQAATNAILREIRGSVVTARQDWRETLTADRRILVPKSLVKKTRYGWELGNNKTDQLLAFHGTVVAGDAHVVNLSDPDVWVSPFPHTGELLPDLADKYVPVHRNEYLNMFWNAHQRGYKTIERYEKAQVGLVREMRATSKTLLGDTRRAALDVLSKHRQFGGALDINTGKGADALKANVDFIPTDWIERSNTVGRLEISGDRRRGHYRHFDMTAKGWVSTMRIGSDPNDNVVLHEFGHRVEAINPMVVALERAYYDERTKGEDLISIKRFNGYGHYKDPAEKTRPDRWLDLYKGKPYGNRGHFRTNTGTGQVSHTEAYELLSMGFWEAFTDKFARGAYNPPTRVGNYNTGSEWHKPGAGHDPEFKAFIYGLILEA